MKEAEVAFNTVNQAISEYTESYKRIMRAYNPRNPSNEQIQVMRESLGVARRKLSQLLEDNKSCVDPIYMKRIVFTLNDRYITIAELYKLSPLSIYRLCEYTYDCNVDEFFERELLQVPNAELIRLFYFKGALQDLLYNKHFLSNIAKLSMGDIIKDIFEKSDNKLALIAFEDTTLLHLDANPRVSLFQGTILPLDPSNFTTSILRSVDKATRMQLLKSVDGNGNTPLHLAIQNNTVDNILCVEDINIDELLAIKNNCNQIPADFIYDSHKKRQVKAIAKVRPHVEIDNFQTVMLLTKGEKTKPILPPDCARLIYGYLAKLHEKDLIDYKPNHTGVVLQQTTLVTNSNIQDSTKPVIAACVATAAMCALAALFALNSSQEERGGCKRF